MMRRERVRERERERAKERERERDQLSRLHADGRLGDCGRQSLRHVRSSGGPLDAQVHHTGLKRVLQLLDHLKELVRERVSS